jgi:hypothetical protein
MAAITLTVMLLVPLLGYVGVRAVLDSTGGKDAKADNLPVQYFPSTPTGALLAVDDAGVLAGVTVVVLAPSGVGGSIVPVAVNADIGFGPEQRQSLQQVHAESGVDGTIAALESLLLISLNFWEESDAANIAALLLPFQPFDVALTSPVVDPSGEEARIEQGQAVLDAVTATKVLVLGAGTGDETARVHNAEAVWLGVSAAVTASPRPAPAPASVPTSFDDLVRRLVGGPVGSRGLDLKPAFTEDENPDGLDVVEVDQSDSVFVFATIAPGSMSSPKLGPMVRIEAPPGYDDQVKRTIATILFVNSNVVSVATTSEPQPNTVLLVPDDANRVRVGDLILGTISFGEPTVRIDGVDVTIVLGTDYLESVTL